MDPALSSTDVPIVVAHGDTSKAWTSLRLALAGLWLVAMVAGYVTHERPATLPDLYASVAAGEVASVQAVTTDDVAREVAARDPGVQVVQSDVRTGLTSTLFGWSVPMWVASLMFGVGVVSFYVLVAGPEPWRATRWAWFWLSGFPFALIVFLLLSGPTPAVPAPRNPSRRLTGGWAFLLSLVLPRTLAT